MNKTMIAVLVLLSLLAGSVLPVAAGGEATLSFFIGVVQAKSGEGEWQQAMFGQKLKGGDQIKTAEESRAELTLGNGSVVRIGEKTVYTLLELSSSDDGSTVKSQLSMGKVWSNVKKMTKKKSEFKIRTPTAIAAIRGTIYDMEIDKDTSATVKVYDGEVEVSSPAPPPPPQEPTGFQAPKQTGGPQVIAPPRQVTMEQWVEVIKAQQQIFIARDGTKKVSEFDLKEDEKDDWVKWNKERDKQIKR